MALDLYDGSDEFFDVFGKLAYAASAIDAGGDSARTRLLAVVTAFEAAPNDLAVNAIIADANRASTGYESASASAMGLIRTICRNYLVQLVANDTDAANVTLSDAVDELVEQMGEQTVTVQRNATSYSSAFSGDGDGVLVVSLKRGDGLTNELAFAEVITLNATDDAGRTMRATGTASVDVMSPLWPQGSAAATTLTVTTASSSRVQYGDFEEASTSDENIPKGWILTTGQPGVTVGLTSNEEQTVAISGTPTGGYYLLSYTASDGKIQTTDQIAYSASASAVQSALRKLTGLSKVTVTATGTSPNFTHTVKFTGVGGDVALIAATNYMTGATSVNEQQRIALSNTDGGTFTLTFNGSTTAAIAYDATSSEIDAALEALGNVASGDLTCAGGPLPATPVTVTFGGTLAGANVGQMTVNTGSLTRTAPSVTVVESLAGGSGALNETQTITASGVPNGGTWTISWSGQTTSAIAAAATAYDVRDALCALSNIAGTDEVQTLTITGTPTGGTFTITYSGQTTAGIAYNANAATVQAALEALSNIGAGDVVCTGGALPGTPVVITFRQALGRQNVALMTASGAGLTGGTSPAAAVSLTTQGVDSDVTVTGGPLGIAAFTVTFVNSLASANQVEMTVATGSLLGPNVTVSVATITPGSASQNEVQSFQLYGTPTGGTFTLTYDGQTTSAIAYNANSATIDAALEALSNIGSGDITIGGGPLPGSAVTVTFGGALAQTNVSQLTINGASLTGGSISAAVSTVTPGATSLNTNLAAYYKLDETSGTRYDSVGIYDLSETTGSTPSLAGVIGNSAALGISSGGTIPYLRNGSFSKTGTNGYSMSCWAMSGATAGVYTGSLALIYIYSTSTSVRYRLVFNRNTNKVSFRSDSSSTDRIITAELTAGTWYHFALTISAAGTATLYQNGSVVGTYSIGAAPGTVSTLSIGELGSVSAPTSATTWAAVRCDECGVWTEALSAEDVTQLYNSGSGETTPFDAGANEVQRITVNGSPSQGTFTLSYGGQTSAAIPYDSTAEEVEDFLEAMSSIGTGNVSCSGGDLPGSAVDVEFTGDLGSSNLAQMTIDDNGLKTSIATTTVGDPGTNEVQRLSASPAPVAGTFTLTYDGQTTSSIAYNASAATIQTALEALSNIAPGDVVCTGGPINTASVTIAFAGALADTNVPEITASSSLTGASPTTVTVDTIQDGNPATNEVQLITLGNSPTGGTFTLTHSAVTSGAIAYNASAATVQTTLNAMSIATFSVSGSAGGPWSVTFGGALAATNVALFTSSSSLTNTQPSGTVTTTQNGSPDSGSITITETVAGDAEVYAGGRAMWFEGDGSELTSLHYKLTLNAATPYALNCWMRLNATDATGVIKFELVDGISGTVIQDDQSTNNAITVNVDDLTTSFQALTELVTEPVFRTPTKMPPLVYLRVRFSTAPTSGTRAFFDDLALVAMTELYAGGPFAALFGGAGAFRVGDKFTLTVSNDYGGDVHQWANRMFGLGASRQLLPSVASSPAVPDSVIG